jgi:hypothetical protein
MGVGSSLSSSLASGVVVVDDEEADKGGRIYKTQLTLNVGQW